MKLSLLTLSIILLITQVSTDISSLKTNEANRDEIGHLFKIIEDGQQNIKLSEQRDITLVLGNAGSGQSILCQWLFSDNDKLIATRTVEGSFYIVDRTRIDHSAIKSESILPELVIDESTGAAYYACPGLGHTRSTTSHDIAATYFIKKVADHARAIRLVFTVDYSSLRQGVERHDFPKLLIHATDLIKDVEKFANSIALIATNVDNSYVENEDGNLVLISDEKVINGIADFLTEVKDVLNNDSTKGQDFIDKAVQFLNILLMKNTDGVYSRLGIFRLPSRPGPLSEIAAFQTGKKHVRRVLNAIVYGNKSVEDFGYTVSDRSKNDISDLVRRIGATVEANLDKIGSVLLDKLHVIVKHLESSEGTLDEENVNLKEMEEVGLSLVVGTRAMSRVVRDILTLKNFSQLPQTIRSSFLNLKLDFNVNEMLNIISKQSEYFNFLQLVSKKIFQLPKSWALNWEKKAQNLTILNNKFQNYTNSIVKKVVYRVDDLFSSVGRAIYDYHTKQVEGIEDRINLRLNNVIKNVNYVEVSKMKQDLNEAVTVTFDLIRDIQNVKDLTLLYERVITSMAGVVNEETTTNLKKCLYFLNNKVDEKMRKSWSILFEMETRGLKNLGNEFGSFINSWIKSVYVRIEYIIANTMKLFHEHCKNLTLRISFEINSFVNGSSMSSSPLHLRKLIDELNKGFDIVSNLSVVSVYQDLTNPLELFQEMALAISRLGVASLDKETASILKQINHLDFLLRVNNEVFAMPVNWIKLFKATADSLTELKSNCQRTVSDRMTELKNSISDLLGHVDQSIRHYYEKVVSEMRSKMDLLIIGNNVEGKKVDPFEAKTFSKSLMLGINTTLVLIETVENLNDVTLLAGEIKRRVNDIDIELSADLVENFAKNCLYLNYLQIVIDETNAKVERSWVVRFENTAQYLFRLRDGFRSSSNVIVLDIESTIEDLIEKFSDSFTEYYERKLNEAKVDFERFTLNSQPRKANVSKGREVALNFYNGLTIMSNLSTRIKNLSTSSSALSSVINDSISIIPGFYFNETFFKNITFHTEVLDFVLLASGIRLRVPNQWLTPIQKVGAQYSRAIEIFIRANLNETRATVYSLIMKDLETSARNLIKHYESKILNRDTSVALTLLKDAEKAISKLLDKNKNARDLFSYMDNIIDCLTELNIDQEVIDDAINRVSHLEYMRAFSKNEIIISPLISFQPFESLLKFVKESYTWYKFLIELDEKLSGYEIQKDASGYDVANLDDWGKYYKFLKNLNVNLEINKTEITESRLRALKNVFRINVRTKYEANCENSEKIVLRGVFIKFSDLIDENHAFRNPCPLFNSRNINIFAAKTVFIDRNLIAVGKQFKILIVSPKWEVIGSGRSIVLDGENGPPISPNRAESGKYSGNSGEDGKAGLPGTSAGSFLGIGSAFINGNQLRVSANGGRGGQGQHGGHGKDGQDGDFVKYEQIDDEDKFGYDRLSSRVETLGLKYKCEPSEDRKKRQAESSENNVCEVYGKSGEKGGNGGKGGVGGDGGKAGNVEIVELGFASKIYSKSRSPGLDGPRGEGGEGGRGGQSQKVKLDYKEDNGYHMHSSNDEVEFKLVDVIKEMAENGKLGI